jgi:hypothetical protein
MKARLLRATGVATCALLLAAAGFVGRAPAAAAAAGQATTLTTTGGLAIITLAASNSDGGPGHPVTLVATSNVDVTLTPYYIEIYDISSGLLIAECGAGTTCDGPAEVDSCVVHQYRAYIGDDSATPPPTNTQATSNTVNVEWWGLSFSANPTGQVVDNPVQLTASTCRDVTTTPYYIDITNDTTSLQVASCPSGTSCTTQDTELLPLCIRFTASIETHGASATAVAGKDVTVCWGL